MSPSGPARQEEVSRTVTELDQSGDPADDPDTPEGRGGASAVLPAGRPSTGRPGLDRRRILGAAVEFIDRNGLNALTMRRLGAHLGVEAMALYRYVPGRETLLDGVVETVIDELYGDPDVHMDATHGWADYLQRLAHGVRRIALAHPEVFPLVATRPPSAPWIRPPLRSLRWVESFLDVLTGSGFTDETAVAAYRAYSSFLLGHLLLEVSQKGVKISPEDEPEGAPETGVDVGQYPLVVELEPLLSLDESAAEFEEALETLLERLQAVLAESRGRGGRRRRR
jgi:AcrR family transcriptional regulator